MSTGLLDTNNSDEDNVENIAEDNVENIAE
ncbi:WD_REPEATS_REGION domain-containing protein, partial [Trichonephila inaurata madagascariensis]